jgi:hypothetical protein
MRFTINAKLASAFGLVILLSFAAGLLAIRDLGELNDGVNQLLDGPVERVTLGQQIELAFSNGASLDLMSADGEVQDREFVQY